MNTVPPNATAPLLSADPIVRAEAVQAFWKTFHTLLNRVWPPDCTLNEILALIGTAFGADRAYTFSVTAGRMRASCTNEWVRLSDDALKPGLQQVEQKGLSNWLDCFTRAPVIAIEDTLAPPAHLCRPAEKFRRDRIRSIYVFGFYDDGALTGYLGLDYIYEMRVLDDAAREILLQTASTLNLFILRHDALELWSRTAATLPTALFIKDVDNDLRYCYTNAQYRAWFGGEMLGKDDEAIFGREVGKKFRQQDLDCLRTGEVYREDGPQPIRGKGEENYYSLVKFPVVTKMGHHRIAGFITDISKEHALRLAAEKLLKKAQAAEQAKSMFLAAMSHEIRTPLNAIIGLVDELRHADISEGTRTEYLMSVATASRALLALINDVLDISKIEAGQMHTTNVETDPVLLLGECESIFAESCRGKGLSYKCEVSPDLPVLIIDLTRLRQILFNLIGNAVKFTERGGIYVYGSFVRGANRRGTLTLEVSDTGPGIAPEEQEKVFGLFEQASRIRGTAAANRGTGLGLCLCKRLAECLNGEINLKSTLGKGSTFTVVLRDVAFVERADSSDVVRHRKDMTIKINPISLSACVLIVDDVPLNLKVLGIILRRMQIRFIPASGGEEALAKLEEDSSGITHVLTDIWMPGLNGEGLAREIRKRKEWGHIRIAAQTADVEASDTFDVKLFDTVLSKPITPEKVLAFLQLQG